MHRALSGPILAAGLQRGEDLRPFGERDGFDAEAGRPVLLVLATLAAAGILACAALALFGDADLICNAMKDDGFYFLTLARNVAQGNGATFDGIALTNGFHPLWTVVLTPIFWFPTSSLMAPVRLTILLAIAIQIAGAWAVRRAARPLAGEWGARAGALFYLANPLGLYLVVSGMESALVGLLVALLAGESIRMRLGERSLADAGQAVRVGLLCGLVSLARTDTIMLAGLVLAGALLLPAAGVPATAGSLRRIPAPSPFGPRLRGALVVVAVMLATVAPWVVWNLARFGTIVQVSARSHHLHAVTNRGAGAPEGLAQNLRVGANLARGLADQFATRLHIPFPLAVALLVAGVAFFALWMVHALRAPGTRGAARRALRALDAPVLYAVGFLAATFLVLGHIRSWYIAGPLAVGALLVSLPARFGWGDPGAPRAGRLMARIVFVVTIAGHMALAPVYAHHIVTSARTKFVWREVAEWVGAHTEPGTRVASFNSGSFGYLSPRTVVNLDCVVNNPGMEALEQRRLIEFLRDWQIRYVIDDEGYVNNYMRAYGGMGKDWRQAVVPVDSLRSRMRVYEVQPRP